MDTLYYYIPALESVRDFFELGGPVLFLIALVTLIMWALIFERMFFLRRKHPQNVNKAIQIWENRPERQSWYAHQERSRLVSAVSQLLDKNISLISNIYSMSVLGVKFSDFVEVKGVRHLDCRVSKP